MGGLGGGEGGLGSRGDYQGGRGGSLEVSGASAHVTVLSPQRLLSFPTPWPHGPLSASCPRFLRRPVSSLTLSLCLCLSVCLSLSLSRGDRPLPPQVPVRWGSVLHTRAPEARLRRATPGPGLGEVPLGWAGLFLTACPPLGSRMDCMSQP